MGRFYQNVRREAWQMIINTDKILSAHVDINYNFAFTGYGPDAGHPAHNASRVSLCVVDRGGRRIPGMDQRFALAGADAAFAGFTIVAAHQPFFRITDICGR